MRKRGAGEYLGIFLIALLPVSQVTGNEPGARSEFYLGVIAPRHQIGGDFNGEGLFVAEDFILLVPDIESAMGIGLQGGIKLRRSNNFSWGVGGSFQYSKHNAKQGPINTDASYFLVTGDFKLYFQPDSRLQPFFQAGLTLPMIQVHDGYLSSTETKNATYRGLGFGMGPGVLYYMGQNTSAHAGVIYRRSTFNSVDYGSLSRLDKSLTSQTVDFEFGLSYHFHLD